MAKDMALIFEDMPDRTRRGGESKYSPFVREFNESGKPTARVAVEGVAFQAIASGLKTSISQLGLGNVLGVQTRANAGVYLVRKPEGEAPKK